MLEWLNMRKVLFSDGVRWGWGVCRTKDGMMSYLTWTFSNFGTQLSSQGLIQELNLGISSQPLNLLSIARQTKNAVQGLRGWAAVSPPSVLGQSREEFEFFTIIKWPKMPYILQVSISLVFKNGFLLLQELLLLWNLVNSSLIKNVMMLSCDVWSAICF